MLKPNLSPLKFSQAVGFSGLLLALTLILHSAFPLWFILIIFTALGWFLLQQQANNNNKAFYKVTVLQVNIAAALILLALIFTIRQAGVLSFMLQMLLLAATCRLLLLQRATEHQQLIWVQYFLLASCFILHQSMLMALVIFALIGLNLYLHFQLFAPVKARLQQRSISQSLIIIIPLWLASFILFPRLAPFWQIPNVNMASTGLGDTIDPGSIEQLVQNDSVAFRVEFEQHAPAQHQLYWRAKLYESFDGRSWHVVESADKVQPTHAIAGKQSVNTTKQQQLTYKVIAEPSQQQSLFALADPVQSMGPVQILPTGIVQANTLISQRLPYQISSIEQPVTLVSKAEQTRNLKLANGNNASKQFAEQLFSRYPTAEGFVAALAEHFNQEPYFYSLRPPLLGKNSIDQFIFETRTGFCSHYASAAAFMLRSVGIAARVVGGYQGGTWYPAQNYLQVTQREAHAWVEYLVDDKWYRFDPTAAVAPERVMQDLSAALTAEQRLLLNSGWQQLSWVNDLRQQWRHLDYYWSVWVLGFDTEQQLDIWRTLKRYLWQLALSSLVLFAIIALIIIVLKRKKQRHGQAVATLLMQQYVPILWQSKAQSSSVSAYLQQLSLTYPNESELLNQLSKCYEQALYQQDAAALAALKQMLRRNKKRLRRFFRMVQNT